MFSSVPRVFYDVLAIGIVILVLYLFSPKRPPGPKGDLFVGHARYIGVPDRWKLYREWGKQYGDLVYTHVFGRSMVIINSYKLANELMDHRGSFYSDRPRMVLIEEMMKLRSITFLSYNDLWKTHRKITQKFFNARSAVAFHPQQQEQVYMFLENVKTDPQNLLKYFTRYTGSVIMTVTYGHPIETDDDQYLVTVKRANDLLVGSGPPGGTMVDFFPFLKWRFMPWGKKWRELARNAEAALDVMMNAPFHMVRKQMAEGKAPPSILAQLLDEYEQRGVEDPEEEQSIKEVAGSLYRAAAETSEAVLSTFVIAMIHNPHVQKKAQEEVDRVIGRDRLPTTEDRPTTPYLECVLKECLRWEPPFPLGIPHRVTVTDKVEDMTIPKGSLIVPNVWNMMMNPEEYDRPEEFNPERFLGNAESKDPILEPSAAVFGFGRRICPGRFFAETSIWLAMACLLLNFDILPSLDENGDEVFPEPKYTTGFTRKSYGYNCRLKPRT